MYLDDLFVTSLNINHPKIGDLEVSLTSPNGTTVILIDNVCGNSANIPGISLHSGPQIGSVCPPLQGSSYSPSFPLTPFINAPIIGVWTLTIRDQAAGGSGTLTSWGLTTISSCPPTPTPTPPPIPECGPAWREIPTYRGYGEIHDVAALSRTNIWAAAEAGVLRWDGNGWNLVHSVPSTGLRAVAAGGPDDVWVVGGRGVYSYPDTTFTAHWDGSTWATVPSPNPGERGRQLTDVIYLAPNNVWAVGHFDRGTATVGFIIHWNGTTWTLVPFNDYVWPLNGVGGSAPNDLWAVGAQIYHYNGATWDFVSWSPKFSELYAVDALSSDDAWAVGVYWENQVARSLVMHWTSGAWVQVAAPDVGALNDVVALAPNGIWAVGERGILHYDGSTWTLNTSAPLGISFNGLSASSSNDMWAVGQRADQPPSGAAFHYPDVPLFSDVPFGHTFYDAVLCLACRGIISGYSDGTFRPNNQVTRGQLAKIISNAAGFSENPYPQIFEDVPPANTFYEWINRLARRGHMSGYPCGGVGEPCTSGMPYFRPFANATRGQTSKIVSNAARFAEEPSEQTFEDVPSAHTFYREIQRLASRGIMGGYPCGGVGEPCLSGKPYFRPANNVTRGQSAKIVANTFYRGCVTP